MPQLSARFIPGISASLLVVALSWFSCALAGDAAPPNDNAPEVFFDSALPLQLIVATGPFHLETLGQTPTAFAPGIPLPRNTNWGIAITEIEKHGDPGKFAALLAAEIRKNAVPMLQIQNPELSAGVLKALAGCETLKWLHTDTQLDAEQFAAVFQLPGLTTLRVRVPDEKSAVELARLPKLARLWVLSHANDLIVQSLARLPALEELNLGGNPTVTAQCLSALAELTTLKSLDLTGTAITPRQFLDSPARERFTRLEKLFIGQSTERVDCLPELQQALPGTAINGHPACGNSKSAELTDAFRAELDGIVTKLGSDEFDVREAAQRQLFKNGPRIEQYLGQKLKQMKANDDPEVRNSLQRIILRLKHYDRETDIEQALAELEKAVAEAPLHFRPADPSVHDKLKLKVSFEYVETPLDETLKYLAEFCNVAIAVDPKALEGAPNVTLRVNDLGAEISLEWLLRMAELEYTIRGKAIVVANPQKISRLKLRAHTLQLPLEPGEKPWSVEESRLAAELLNASFDAWTGYATEQGKAQPGQIAIATASPSLADAFSYDYKHAAKAGTRLVPQIYAALERKLDVKIDVKLAGKPVLDLATLVNKDEVLLVMGDGPDGNLGERKLPDDFVAENISIREALVKAADALHLRVYPQAGAVRLGTERPERRAFFVDVREALKSGVAVEELRLALQAIAHDHGGGCTERPVRGRWLVFMDAWSGERALALLADVAKTGKIPAKLPPLAWFSLTLDN